MQTNEYLFPNRLTRRDFLKIGAAAAAGLATTGIVRADVEQPAPALPRSAYGSGPFRIGSGANTYEWVESWGQLPPGMTYGFGCGVVVDSQDRVYVTSRSNNPCVVI